MKDEKEVGYINNKQLHIELEPVLEACVSTLAKIRYNQVASELLQRSKKEELTREIRPLRLFLETADFNKLRGESEPHLVEGRKAKFRLHLEEGKPEYEMKVTE
jgi:hypothetical protein